LCLDPLHVSGVKRPSSGGTTLADFGVSYVHCSFWLVAHAVSVQTCSSDVPTQMAGLRSKVCHLTNDDVI
jgi:hypothetical protein